MESGLTRRGSYTTIHCLSSKAKENTIDRSAGLPEPWWRGRCFLETKEQVERRKCHAVLGGAGAELVVFGM